ncbi:MAG: M14 family metallopeptidase [Ferruginibacter sp.]|nr:M14 family metallopeptidase [Ferruginibacter sp.]
MIKISAAFFCNLVLIAAVAQGQENYSNFSGQLSRLSALSKSYPQLTRLTSLTKTAGGKDIWQLTLGSGNVDQKPAIVIAGGVEGNHVLGTELAISFAENLLKGSGSDSIKALLAKTTFYIFPNLSPDAMEQFFDKMKYARQGNATSTDDDRDGRSNEDGFEDLDGNGKITWMRIESPVGDYKTHPDDVRVLVKADAAKGEQGKYLVRSEGSDNDKDGEFNEDGAGGVWFNKNLSYKHPSFTQGSGEFAVSELETRAVLDYLYDRFNVYAVVSFGSLNNLSNPYTFTAATATQPRVASWLEADVKVNTMVSDLYTKQLTAKDAPKTTEAGGDFLSWAYYHYGRYSFSTPGWWVPKTKPDSLKNEKAFAVDDVGAHYFRWVAQQNLKPEFTEWKTITHPDFPGQKVEVGGLDPFALYTPPFNLVAGIAKKHTEFLVKLAALQPEIDIINIKTEKPGSGLTRVTVDIINKGALASPSKLGERSYFVKRINVKISVNGNQSVISGRKIQVLNSLDGYGSQKLSWLIKGTGKVVLEAGSPTTGSKTIEINL